MMPAVPPHTAPAPLTVPIPPFSRLVPIGPSSAPLTSNETASFANDAQKLLKKAVQRCAELEKVLEGLGRGEGGGGFEGIGGGRERVEKRCSVQSFFNETARLTSDPTFSNDLRSLLRKRWVPVEESAAPAAKRRKRDVTEEVEEGTGGQHLTGAASERKDERLVDEGAALRLMQEVEKEGPTFLRPPAPKNIEPYLHKARKPDYNSLATVRSAIPPSTFSNSISSSRSDPLSNLVYTLVFHPVSRYSVAGVGRQRHRLYQTPQRQVLVCLGSTTLADVVRELQIAKEKVPKEATSEPSSDEEGDGEEEDEEEDVGIRRGRPAMTGNIGGARKEKKEKRVRWKSEASRTGSVFCVEDVLYADGEINEEETEKGDYAQMVLDLIAETNWPASTTPPELKKGSTTQETKLGEVEKLRVGQPYWFLTGGNVEVVWSVSEIRYRHPLDPTPTSTSSSHPYPLTTYLSRASHSSTSSLSSSASASAAAARCRLCDRDPGAFVLLDDELAGETPALVCEKCLDALHPRAEGEGGEEQEDAGTDELERGRMFMGGEEEGGKRVRIVPVVL